MTEPACQAVLRSTTFGKRIAEEEAAELASYFVETEQWRSIIAGTIDIVYGSKGAGKSAIYSLLISRQSELFDRGLLLTAAENPRGATVFRDLVADPPVSEREFIHLWKLYILTLVAEELRKYSISSASSQSVNRALEQSGLIEPSSSLTAKLRGVVNYIKQFRKIESVGAAITPDLVTGIPSIEGKITFREPDAQEKQQGKISVDTLLALADEALKAEGVSLWILVDRLDVAFAESPELEKNALRALFRVYLDLLPLEDITLKIFLRSDIWKRISQEGFREASHITRVATISWNDVTLLNLVVRRALRNAALCAFYDVAEVDVLADATKQEELFYRIFPDQVEIGSRRSSTLDWMLSRTRDATGETAPRELIHLLSETRDVQLQRWDLGTAAPPGSALFDRAALKEALPEVSRARLEQTIYAEYPLLKPRLQALEREKTEQTPDTLAAIWDVTREEAVSQANQMADIGFFEKRGTRGAPTYWVPFLYRDALDMVQGSAE